MTRDARNDERPQVAGAATPIDGAGGESLFPHLLRVVTRCGATPLSRTGVTPDSPLDGLGIALDSLGVLSLLVALEEEFSTTIDETTVGLDDFRTVGTLMALLGRHVERSS